MKDVVPSLVMGIVFGWALHKAGLTHYARIVNIYRLRDFTVLRFMLTALLVGALGIRVGLELRPELALPLPVTALLANGFGGVVFGIGMAAAGYCPGTIAAEAGEGRIDAWLAGLSGLITGALLFGWLQPALMPALTRALSYGRVTWHGLFAASPWLTTLVFAQLVVLVLVLVRNADADP